ncbi:MAG: SDR family NAD(P)-dependent oxidoreductase [Planctomycetaceae bacterium]|nr:SDR family NAD(P)-dependent oxidoreductase [Planctomycetaceae bacterium]
MPYNPVNDSLAERFSMESSSRLSGKRQRRKPVLVTGGAGFIGVNMAKRLADEGLKVIVLDNLSRPGSESNLEYLREHYHDRVEFVLEDVRNRTVVDELVSRVDMVFHFAAQVAVTASIEQPTEDFEINCAGTLNILEAARAQTTCPAVLFTSTNKVYGSLEEMAMAEEPTRYRPAEESQTDGIDEGQPLDFHTPYGCSKGSADQYVLDYARIYKIPAVVFRMSCIFGPHQFGTEEQGWVAHFMRRMMQNKDVTIYGNGKQVRDLLFIDDLINAMLIVYRNPRSLAGQVFNMGGGPENAVSILEVLDEIARIGDLTPDIRFGDWRQQDQLYYVSDTTRFRQATGWTARVGHEEGIKRLYDWFCLTAERPAVTAGQSR